MAHKVRMPADAPVLWDLEAEAEELHAYVSTRVQDLQRGGLDGDGGPIEPAWFREAWEIITPMILAEIDAW